MTLIKWLLSYMLSYMPPITWLAGSAFVALLFAIPMYWMRYYGYI